MCITTYFMCISTSDYLYSIPSTSLSLQKVGNMPAEAKVYPQQSLNSI